MAAAMGIGQRLPPKVPMNPAAIPKLEVRPGIMKYEEVQKKIAEDIE